MELIQIDFIPIQGDKFHFTVKVKNLSAGGEASVLKTQIPFVDFLEIPEKSKNWRHTLLKILESEDFKSNEFDEAEIQWLLEQGLLHENLKNFQHSFTLTKIGTSFFQ